MPSDEVKHTPGPWFYDKADEWSHSVSTHHGELPDGSLNSWLIASINKNREPEHEANARLIAAAPDLLSIVQRLTLATNEGDDAAQGTHYVDREGRIRCKGSFLELIENARAAIAKATGAA